MNKRDLNSFRVPFKKVNKISGQVILDELYRVKGGSVRSFRLGVWKEGKGFIGQWPPPFIWERRSNLSGVTLVDTTISYSWFANFLLDRLIVLVQYL